MKFCKHCGTKLEDHIEICMNCGCSAINKFTLTLKRENQFFLANPPIKIDIFGSNSCQQLEINNGEILSIELQTGRYKIVASSSIRKSECDVDLTCDRIVRIAWNRFNGKLETWEISKL